MVAVTAIVAHSYLSNKANKIMDDIDRYSVSIINLVSEQYRTVRNRSVSGSVDPSPINDDDRMGAM